MSPAQLRGLAFWAALMSAAVCFGFLPLSPWGSALLFLAMLVVIAVVWYAVGRRVEQDVDLQLDGLPQATYRQPVVLVCGDLPQTWPVQSQVLTVAHGCWIRVEDNQNVEQVARQLLWLRPNWGRQLSVLLNVCPQKHANSDILTNRLLALRWQISQLRRDTGNTVPLVLSAQAGSTMMNNMLWEAAISGEGIRVWRQSSAPSAIPAWVSCGGETAMQQQVLMNCLMSGLLRHVNDIFMDDNPDIPVIPPIAMLWGIGPILCGSLASSAWTDWLTQHTAMRQVAGWQPVGTDSSVMSLLPDFILPLLPEGQGLTPRSRTWRCALGIFTLAAIVALISSGWNNRQLLHRLSFDIARYERLSMDDYGPKAKAVAILRQDAAQLDGWARNGVPMRMSLGLYQGDRLRMPLLDVIRSYVPPRQPQEHAPEVERAPAPTIIRLDSMSLFDSGKSVLKSGSTKMLVNSLVGIKAKPGWLIVVAGHTDNTGNQLLNQMLSQKRAEAVRNWMRDTGDVPESCFAVQGYGESRPLATNDTPEGRALNRRVEISLVPQASACHIPGKTNASSQHNGE